MKIEARDVWDDLMEQIDLSGAYETFIDPTAIAALFEERNALKVALQDALDALEVSAPPESPIQQRQKAHARAIRNAKRLLNPDNSSRESDKGVL